MFLSRGKNDQFCRSQPQSVQVSQTRALHVALSFKPARTISLTVAPPASMIRPMTTPLPVGKLPAELLQGLLQRAPLSDERVLLGPQPGVDCAVLDLGDRLLVIKSDPITFATESIGWYLVQVNSNDIAAMGATPRWLLVTMLLPEDKTSPELVLEIGEQIYAACRAMDISVIGGHTEITHGVERPILAGTLIGEVAPEKLVTPQGMQPGDHILLTKGVPIEGTALLAGEFPERLRDILTEAELAKARDYLTQPGISVLRDAQIATGAGQVTAMHDPTEGGLAAALWELAVAGDKTLLVDVTAVPVPSLAARICAAFDLDPLATIASGALLLTAAPNDVPAIITALAEAGIPCATIGRVAAGPPQVRQQTTPSQLLPRPKRDEIARIYEQ
jgi:hydrogenase expression/formation protein HypE